MQVLIHFTTENFCAKKLIENIGFGEYHMRSI